MSGMSIGSMSTTTLTAPIAHVSGWRTALMLPAVLALAAIIRYVARTCLDKKLSQSSTTRNRVKLVYRKGTALRSFSNNR
ncbi:hypothetical protein [Desulfobacter curvatus]|uniref:hypothetical protein n=1 Tax=Desulfobacter curvatus TaxID=2290 RepID=UPI0003A7891B|nr:hypothetical protein [Desulfobacter curvatus]